MTEKEPTIWSGDFDFDANEVYLEHKHLEVPKNSALPE